MLINIVFEYYLNIDIINELNIHTFQVIFFSISIIIPTSLFIYYTLLRRSNNQSPSYVKWCLFFIVTYLFNGLSLLQYTFITIIDFGIKIALIYLPEKIVIIVVARLTGFKIISGKCIFRELSKV